MDGWGCMASATTVELGETRMSSMGDREPELGHERIISRGRGRKQDSRVWAPGVGRQGSNVTLARRWQVGAGRQATGDRRV